MACDKCLRCGGDDHYIKQCSKVWYCSLCNKKFKDYDKCNIHEKTCNNSDIVIKQEDMKQDIINSVRDVIK
jgi:hypothetical protein